MTLEAININTDRVVLDANEAANMIGVSRSSLQRLLADGEWVPAIRLSARRRGYLRRDVLDWLEARKVRPA